MDNGVDGILGEQGFYCGKVAEIHHFQREVFPAGDFLDAFVAGAVAIGEIVGHHHIVAGFKELYGYVTADKTGATRYQNSLFHSLLVFSFCAFIFSFSRYLRNRSRSFCACRASFWRALSFLARALSSLRCALAAIFSS